MNIDERLENLAKKGRLTFRHTGTTGSAAILMKLETTIYFKPVEFTGAGATLAEAIKYLESSLNATSGRLRIEVKE